GISRVILLYTISLAAAGVLGQLLGEVAGGLVAGRDFAQGRLFGALVFGERTAGAEDAAFGTGGLRSGVLGRLAGARIGVRDGDGGEESAGVGVARVDVDLLAVGQLYDFAQVHHG